MAEQTPSQPEALDETSKMPSSIEIEMKKAGGATTVSLPLQSKLAHLLAVVITGVIALFVSACLADGASVIRLKDASELPRITDKAYIKKGLNYRADELLGPRYGVGLHHDSSGTFWSEANAGATLTKYIEELGEPQVIAAVPSVIATDGLKHPVHFLSCHQLKKAGLSAMALAIIAEVASALMIIFHGMALVGLLGGVAKYAKVFSALIWFTLVAGFMVVIGLALGIMEEEWTCENPFIPKIKLSEHFRFTYGIIFGYIGYVSALLVLCVQLVFTSTKDGAERPADARYSVGTSPAAPSLKAGLFKVLGGVVVGLVLNAAISLSVVGGVGYFKAPPPLDPEYNYCAGQKPYDAGPGDNYFDNVACEKKNIVQVLEQAGANITRGYVGGLDAGTWRVPITSRYVNTDLCPVNVHWHLGAEHYSAGEFDEYGTGPKINKTLERKEWSITHPRGGRELASKDKKMRLGYRCHHYKEDDAKFTTEYKWQYCTNMKVGETYEVHWPHSAAGACGTDWQYQTPFYDGVFCKDGVINMLTPLNTYEKIGVQGQVFVIVNDEEHKIDNLFDGMVYDKGDFGDDIAMYTGSTTGTTRDNEICSRYAPITWQVDRKCHLASASSFDAMCKKMMEQKDDMSGDVYPHGARELVDTEYVANNQQSRE